MREIEKKTKSDGSGTFFAYMITPVQRIPRYVLLLKVCFIFSFLYFLGIEKANRFNRRGVCCFG